MNSSMINTSCRHLRSCSTVLNHWVISRTAASAAASLVSNSSIADESTDEIPKSQSKANQIPITNSFVVNLFRGHVVPKEIFPYPSVLNEEQQENLKTFIDPLWRFFEERNDAGKNDLLEKISDDTINDLKDQGAFGLQIPVQYDGLGLNHTQAARLFEIIGAHDLGISVLLSAHQSIGLKAILLFGTETQKQKYLPKLANGRSIAAFCLTEPSTGNDIASIQTKAELTPDGKYFILNGVKLWVSNGGIADVFTVFAQTSTMNEKTGQIKNQMTAFLVERKFPGISNGPAVKKMGIKASNTTEVYLRNCKVPVENILGGIGNGHKVAVNVLNHGRFSMVASLSGAMKMTIRKTINHAKHRRQFGRTIDTYGNVQEKLVRMAARQYVTESLAFLLAQNMDRGIMEYQCEAAIGKIFASESAWYVLDEAIQIHGGMGYMQSAGLERVMRDLRVFRIFEGNNDILRLFVALTGLQHVSLHLRDSLQNGKHFHLTAIVDEGSKLFRRGIGMTSRANMNEHVDPSLHRLGLSLSKAIDRFGSVVERNLLKYGTTIHDEQFLLHRMGDIAIDLFTMAVSLSRCTNSLRTQVATAAHESQLTRLWCEETYDRVNENINSIESSSFVERNQLMTISARELVNKTFANPVH